MGFFIQDDYIDSMADMNRAEQNAFLGAIFRLYTTGVNESDSIKSKVVRAAFNSCEGRVISARKEAEKKNEQRGKNGDNPEETNGTHTGTKPGTDAGTNIGNAHIKEGEGEREVVGEIEREVGTDVVDVVPLAVYEGGEIVSEPDGFAHFMAESIKRFNAATGKNYLAAPAPARQGMLEAYRAGRTLDDVDRVMADVASWPKRMHTLNAVWADGKFEQHVNRDGGERRDWSQYNYLMS